VIGWLSLEGRGHAWLLRAPFRDQPQAGSVPTVDFNRSAIRASLASRNSGNRSKFQSAVSSGIKWRRMNPSSRLASHCESGMSCLPVFS